VRQARPPYDIDRLTDVALSVFAERGFDGASMDNVATKAGITKAAIYHHVSGKDELLERGLNRALEALFGVLGEPGAAVGKPIERLRFIVHRVAALAVALRPELTVLVRVRGNTAVERQAIVKRRNFDAAVAQLVRDAQADGSLAGDLDAGVVVRLVFGMCNSLVEWYRPGGALPPEAIAATVVRLVFDGAATRA
jgi:AcrR family transcriptional regulator